MNDLVKMLDERIRTVCGGKHVVILSAKIDEIDSIVAAEMAGLLNGATVMVAIKRSDRVLLRFLPKSAELTKLMKKGKKKYGN